MRPGTGQIPVGDEPETSSNRSLLGVGWRERGYARIQSNYDKPLAKAIFRNVLPASLLLAAYRSSWPVLPGLSGVPDLWRHVRI